MQRLIINLIGNAGSGKSTLCSELERDYSFFIYRASDALRVYAAEHGITLNGRKDYVECHRLLIADDPLAIIEPVLTGDDPRVCIDGLRGPLPFLELKKRYNAIMIYLDVPIELRLQRLQADATRSGHRVPPTMEALIADEAPDEHNPDRNLPNMAEMRKMADHVVDGTGTTAQTYAHMKALIEPLLAKYGR